MVNQSPLLPSREFYSSRKEWEEACWKKIEKSGKFLGLLVTSNERHNIIMRAAVMRLTKLGKGARQIARELQVSRQTISSIKKALKEKGYKSYRERGKTERRKKVYSEDSRKKKEKRVHKYPRKDHYGGTYRRYY
jgi:uncharacterized protein YerC